MDPAALDQRQLGGTTGTPARVTARVFDWSEPVARDLSDFDVVMACDVLYESFSVEPIARVVPDLLGGDGDPRLVLADPPTRTKQNRDRFVQLLTSAGFRLEESAVEDAILDGTTREAQVRAISPAATTGMPFLVPRSGRPVPRADPWYSGRQDSMYSMVGRKQGATQVQLMIFRRVGALGMIDTVSGSNHAVRILWVCHQRRAIEWAGWSQAAVGMAHDVRAGRSSTVHHMRPSSCVIFSVTNRAIHTHSRGQRI